MSNRWPGGVIRKTPVTPAGPLQNGAASGVWTLADAAYWTKQGLWPLAGNTLAVEDVFSTYLYTGNGTTSNTITNGIDLAGKSGLVWIKYRNSASYWHNLIPMDFSGTKRHYSNTTNAFATGTYLTAKSNGFEVTTTDFNLNDNTAPYVSWTFRKAPKFFDTVTWTGNGTTQLISHNLGVTPGFVIYKATSTTSDWFTLARNSDNTYSGLRLNLTNQADIAGLSASSAGLTSTTFNPNAIYGNTDGVQYVAYLYAHDPASDGIIQCGSYTGNGSSQTINLGFEPQWLLVKNATTAGWSWNILDNMRGIAADADPFLRANLADAEVTTTQISLTPTGFAFNGTGNGGFNGSGATYVYMAIRRGPMRTPTLGTSVFLPQTRSGNGTTGTVVTGAAWPMDSLWISRRTGGGAGVGGFTAVDRLRGAGYNNPNSPLLIQNSTDAEQTFASAPGFAGIDLSSQFNYTLPSATGYALFNTSGVSYIDYLWRRAPGFFDEVCYTGTGAARTVAHNLGVAPELMIIKSRSNTGTLWYTYSSLLGIDKALRLNEPDPAYSGFSGILNNTTPSATSFSLATTNSDTNGSGATYVAYLFASAPGVSKVGSYTGNGSSQTINCAFTTGARFVLIKRTDSTGGWLVWDSARGIVAGNDPYLALNSTAAEVTTDDSVDTDSTGFVVNQVAASNVNVNAATYIYFAVS